MAEKNQTNRWRCVTTGCNPVLIGEEATKEHAKETGHRTAKWPVRSAEGKRKARQRNKSGYYDKYNHGDKSPEARGIVSHTESVSELSRGEHKSNRGEREDRGSKGLGFRRSFYRDEDHETDFYGTPRNGVPLYGEDFAWD